MTDVYVFQKYVKGHGQGLMFKIYDTVAEVLSLGIHIANMKALSLTIKKIWLMLFFFQK